MSPQQSVPEQGSHSGPAALPPADTGRSPPGFAQPRGYTRLTAAFPAARGGKHEVSGATHTLPDTAPAGGTVIGPQLLQLHAAPVLAPSLLRQQSPSPHIPGDGVPLRGAACGAGTAAGHRRQLGSTGARARPLSHGQRSQPRLEQNWSRAAQRRFSHSLNTDWVHTLTASSRCSRDEPGLLIRASAVPWKAQILPSHHKVTPRSRENARGELGQEMRCSLVSREAAAS